MGQKHQFFLMHPLVLSFNFEVGAARGYEWNTHFLLIKIFLSLGDEAGKKFDASFGTKLFWGRSTSGTPIFSAG
jgi:hypothetical protein